MYFITRNGPKFWPSSFNPSKSQEHCYYHFNRPWALLIHHWKLLSSTDQVRSLWKKSRCVWGQTLANPTGACVECTCNQKLKVVGVRACGLKIYCNNCCQKLRTLLSFITDQSLVLLPYLSIKTWSEMNTKEGKCRIWHWVNVSANQFGLLWTQQQIFSSKRNYFGFRRTIRQCGHPVGKQSGARQDVITINDLEKRAQKMYFFKLLLQVSKSPKNFKFEL